MLNSSFIVRADNDDEYIKFNDYETAQAYRFWSLYGLTPDTSTSYTQTYSTSGTFTSSANVYLSGTSSTGGSLNTDGIRLSLLEDFKSEETGQLSSIGVAELLNTLSIKVAAENNDRRDQMSLHFGACTAFSNNASGDQVTYNITCDGSTDNYYYNNSTYDITIDDWTSSDPHTVMQWSITPKTDVYMDGNIPYSAYSHENGDFSGVAQINLSESISESGTISTNGTLAFTTTTTNTNSLKYVYPVVKGTITNSDNPSTTRTWKNDPDNPFTVIFLCSHNQVLENFTQIFVSDNGWNEEDNFMHRTPLSRRGGYLLYEIQFYNNNIGNKTCYIQFTQNPIFTNGLIPIYVGYKNYMSDGVYRYVYGSDRLIEAINNMSDGIQNKQDTTNDLIENGNSVTDAAIDSSTDITDEFSDVESDYHAAEMVQIENMDDALEDINTTGGITSNNKFIDASFWVKTQFNRMVNNTPFELMITFSLVLGLALVFIGKLR